MKKHIKLEQFIIFLKIELRSKPFAEYERSIIFLLFKWFNIKKKSFPLVLVLLYFLLLSYPFIPSIEYFRYIPLKVELYNFISMYLYPVSFLLIFDLLFLVCLLPIIRKIILNIEFTFDFFSQDTIFSPSLENFANRHQRNHQRIEEYYNFRLPLLYESNEGVSDKRNEYYLNKLANFIWTVRLGAKKGMREYLYLIILVLFFTVYFLVFHEVYYLNILSVGENFYPISKDKYILFFYISWIIYLIMRLKSISGTNYNYKNYIRFWDSNRLPSVFDQVSIYKFKRDSGVMYGELEYIPELIVRDINTNKERNVEQIINFSTMVLAIIIMTFIT